MMIAGKQAGGQPTRRRWQYLHTQIETVIIDGWDGMEMHAMDQQQQWYCTTVMMREGTYMYQLQPTSRAAI
jgi:hypothetical protein